VIPIEERDYKWSCTLEGCDGSLVMKEKQNPNEELENRNKIA